MILRYLGTYVQPHSAPDTPPVGDLKPWKPQWRVGACLENLANTLRRIGYLAGFPFCPRVLRH